MSADAAKTVLLLGGSSEIGLAIVRRLAADGPVRPYLLGRDRARCCWTTYGPYKVGSDVSDAFRCRVRR